MASRTRALALSSLLMGLASCGDDAPPAGMDAAVPCATDTDCDDGVFCNGPETCDGTAALADARGCVPAEPACGDDGCDEATDTCTPTCATPDADGDGVASIECGGNDCDDDDPIRFPGNTEICDPDDHDEDCDPTTFGYRDSDGDGFGDAACCNGDVCGDDCNDMRAASHPGEAESCDGIDNDCDGGVDEDVLRTFFVDADDDGRGDETMPTMSACFPPDGYSELGGDCDDANPGRHDGLPEICDAAGLDENCDGVANPDELCLCDGSESRGCLLPGFCSGGTEVCSGGMWGECSRRPGLEVCNGVDDDCNGVTDEGLTVECFADPDDDGYALGGAAMVLECPRDTRLEVGGCPIGTTNRRPLDPELDCDEDNDDAYPGAPELCNGLDDDCDGTADEGLTVVIRYIDMDGDGFEGSPVMRCEGDPDSVAVSRDCNEMDTSVYIGAPELCDGKDNNCSFGGAAAGGPDIFEDEDGDGFTSDAIGSYCSGGPFPKTDCNDDPMNGGADDNPSAVEVCSGRDTNCDGTIDEDPAAYDSCSATNASAGCASDGTCRVFACDRGFADCNGDYSDGCEVDTTSSSEHCGGCGIACPGGAACNDGFCPSVVGLATGNANTCVHFSDDSIACSGSNFRGQLARVGGDSAVLVPTAGVSTESTPVVGIDYLCAIVSSGVDCWGFGFYGQLGDGTNMDQGTPGPVTGITSPPEQLSAGGFHACALDGGRVKCWGRNDQGQLGDGSTATERTTPVDVVGLTDAIAIDAGRNSTCAIRAGGSVVCWGDNDGGQVGDGTTTDRRTPTVVPGVTSAVEVSVGGRHACALLADETVVCWGDADWGALGNGTTSGVGNLPGPVSGLSGVLELSAGNAETCVLRREGTTGTRVSCWGQNWEGQLGDGTRTHRSTPVDVLDLEDATAIRTGAAYACALRQSGRVSCWGLNNIGQHANGTLDGALQPGEMPGLDLVAQIDAGLNIVGARRASGTVGTWGRSTIPGFFGAGPSVTTGWTPVETGLVARQVSGGMDFSCAVLADDSMACWGRMIGIDYPNPTTILTGIERVEVGRDNACALALDGRFYCWGRNYTGQVGDGTTTDRTLPTEVALADVVDFSVGIEHSCAVVRTGELYCWGGNGFGPLGLGFTGGRRLSPTRVAVVDDARRVETSFATTCVLRPVGDLVCWGQFWESGSPINDPMARTVSLPPGRIIDLGAGADSPALCAVLEGGTAYCWNGANAQGELGQGDFMPVTDPSPVVTYSDFDRITISGTRACGIRDGFRATACWGESVFIGDGMFTTSPSPVDVPFP